ncbi:MAG TPA: hypothetical protein PK566_13685 [Pseudobacteroides sp.]|nr:hypothetical protein [Pseudobacteroides sp.]
MVIIKVKTRHIGILFAFLLVCAIGLSFYRSKMNTAANNRFEAIGSSIGEFGSDNLVAFLADSDPEGVNRNVEIFDISKGEVIREMETSSVIQKEAENYLKNIDGMFVKANAIPEKGYIIKVAFEPPAKVDNKWLDSYGINSVDQVFVIFPENAIPYLLVLDKKSRPLFYNFEGRTNDLLQILNFQI